MATILDEWRPGDLLIEALGFCGLVALIGGVLLLLLGVLIGSPEPLEEPLANFGLIEQGGEYDRRARDWRERDRACQG